MNLLELPFDQYQRYKMVQEIIDSLRNTDHFSVLDVGASADVLGQFLKRDSVTTTGLKDQPSLQTYSSGLALPFHQGQFDVVASVDSLEHIASSDRNRFLEELSRVSSDLIIVAAPFHSEGVLEAEQFLNELIRSKYGEPYHFLEEHKEHGLPKIEEITRFFEKNGYRVVVLHNGYLHHWVVALSVFFLLQWRFDNSELSARFSSYYNTHFYSSDNREPSYRKVLVCSRNRNLENLTRLQSPSTGIVEDQSQHILTLTALARVITERWSEKAIHSGQEVEKLTRMLQEQTLNSKQEIEKLHQELKEQTLKADHFKSRATNSDLQLMEKERLNQTLEQKLESIQGSIAWRWTQRLYRIFLGIAPYESRRWTFLMKLLGRKFPPNQNVKHQPRVSIIIPVFNNCDLTRQCIQALHQNTNYADLEIIVIDDGSTDETSDFLSTQKDLIVLRNESNLGFVLSCNKAASVATGKYIVLLNNDTRPHSGWLEALVSVAEADPAIGVCGAKLVYPDGRLQEAGGIIFPDGTTANFGNGDDPNKEEYNYPRDTSYCSGACLLVRRDLWIKVGGFDERYSPAYFEDVDLCFAIRSLGYRVIYQPKSEVTHLEGGTAGTDVQKGTKRYQIINYEKFVEKWKSALQQNDVS